jgi:hypothetical protein
MMYSYGDSALGGEGCCCDILKVNRKADPFYEMLNPEHSKEFFNAYRESVNFFEARRYGSFG